WRQGDRAGLRHVGRVLALSGVVITLLLALAIFQLYFYNGAVALTSRYNFPLALVPPFIVLTGVIAASTILRAILKDPLPARLFSVLVTFVLIGLIFFNGFETARASSTANVERTHLFADELSKIEATARHDPDIPLVFDTHDGMDFEGTYSVATFLRH